ncbi:brain-specific angiogenesis inhibitor 1-associated protein 2-like protein 1 isoform X4 [Pipistrellus kuhlii]|uniref:brain-specific angiogenesis inhibitor 1-associated protein 2-like protein 1 isoform X4 n=1 Tax=Pipistrellus kuhlii TaxID=59472 RepID=UPI001E2731EC|nr:brain-specific angiogenesis inhibitor 1-associated protein 2-like protein 1 isoform X4 [Pipistrellus kuhlii]
MSKGPEEVNRLTENTYRNVMEQFNPRLRNLINLGKNYEKAVNAMILAGKAYFDGVAKIGEIATGSPVSTELGHVLIEISSTHQKLDESFRENFKTFHKEIIHELEKKTELDIKYMTATLKRYQAEHRNKLDSLEKSQAELKKIRRKSQGGRNALKYEHKEIEYIETVTSRQSEIQRFIAEGCREALLEEKRRFCFLVDKHCSFASLTQHYHQQAGKDYDTLSKYPSKVPPAPSGRVIASPLIDMFNNPATAAQNSASSEDPSLQRSVSVATGLNMMKRQKVKTIFPHTAGTNQLGFAQGDVITLLVAEEKDGWLYGEHDTSKARGWFPSSYTRLLEENAQEAVSVPSPSPAPVRSMSTMDLSEKSCAAVPIPPPDYLECLSTRAAADKGADVPKPTSTFKALASGPETTSLSNTNGTAKHPFLSGENPFATVKLRPTVTNDRSAPIIR